MNRFLLASLSPIMLLGLAGCLSSTDSSAPEEEESIASAASALTPANAVVNATTGDFTGDGYADYADRVPSNGQFFVHPNQESGTFDPTNWGHGQSYLAAGVDVFVGDFNGDHFADYADHDSSTGTFYVHLNLKNGTFAGSGVNWGQGQTAAGASWQVLVADFTGDGYADYADHDLTTGNFYVHANLKNGTFAGNGVNWGQGKTVLGAGWDVFVGDFNGDGYADYADHDSSTGIFYVHLNLKNGTFAGNGVNWGQGQTAAGANWEVLTGDFTGDGYTDYADHDLISGQFWVHANLKNGTFAGNGVNWGHGQTAAGTEVLGRVAVVAPPPAGCTWGAFAVECHLVDYYTSLGGEARWGAPTQGSRVDGAGYSWTFPGSRQMFWSSATGARYVIEGIDQQYVSMGGPASYIGMPVAVEAYDSDSSSHARHQFFQWGTICWHETWTWSWSSMSTVWTPQPAKVVGPYGICDWSSPASVIPAVCVTPQSFCFVCTDSTEYFATRCSASDALSALQATVPACQAGATQESCPW